MSEKVLSREQAPPAELRFLFSDHSLENYPRILKAIERAEPDIVAVELPGESRAVMQDMEGEVNAQLRGAEPNPDIEIGWFEEDFINRFGGRDIDYRLIDVPSESIAWDYHTSFVYHMRKYDKLISDPDRRRYHARKAMAHSAISMAMREQYTAEMLDGLAGDNPGKRMVAVVGMMHTGLRRYISPDIASSSRFINSKLGKKDLFVGQKANFKAHEAGRRAYLAGLVDIDEMLEMVIDQDGFLRDYTP